MRVLILVLGTRRPPYPALIRGIKDTWASVSRDGVETLFYYGGTSTSLAGEDLVLPVPDDLPAIGRKTIAAFEWSLRNRDFDVVFRTNCSSYVDQANLLDYVLAHAETEGFYSGMLGVSDEVTFASGSGYFLSRDLVELVVQEPDAWRHELLDDEALALLLAGHGISPRPAPRVDYRSVRDVGLVDTSQFHFRCRTDSWLRRDDIRIMRRIHESFLRARGQPSPSRPLAARFLRR